MNRATELELMRLLHGELADGEAGALRERLAGEPELAAAYARLERTWDGLALPAAAPAAAGLAQRTLARARRERAESLSWTLAPVWVRATAAAALAAGLALGAGAGSWMGRGPASDETQLAAEPESATEPSLADEYWATLSGIDSPAATDAAETEEPSGALEPAEEQP